MNSCIKAVNASNRFENENSELKRQYIILNIETIKKIMKLVPGYCGCFGTGYPFYALNNLEGTLPIINEQIRYNEELLTELENNDLNWECESCLAENISQMPDLKRICKPCPKIPDSLKPRKVINRLPDVDMWLICADDKMEEAKDILVKIFNALDMHPSDIDPLKTIDDVSSIAEDIYQGKMPKKLLPLDIHIIEYSKFNELVNNIPITISLAYYSGSAPYLPIHPISLRKDWQYDDTAYNFVLDFLYSLTPFDWNENLLKKLIYTRTLIGKTFSKEELFEILNMVSSDAVKRRFETPQLKRLYERRIESWKK